MFNGKISICCLQAIILISCNNGPKEVPVINYSVAGQYPHDAHLFTEGLFFKDGKLYESTGAPENLPFSRSMIGYTSLPSGAFIPKVELDKEKHFGEGLTFLKNKIYQLTYGNKLGFIYDGNSHERTDSFHYPSKEGWGLTTDGTFLIMSDGTDKLTFLSPENMEVKKILAITEGAAPCDSINELEYIKGFIYANIWLNNSIIKIDPNTGNVIGKMDLTAIVDEVKVKSPDADVLNGIAYDPATNKVFITGKLWPIIYVIKFPL